jgi:predicted Fe-S protein YdhL (DUF1289 family)
MNAALAARADAVLSQSAGQPVISPCMSVCRMDDASGLCVGCLRSLDEIAKWSALDDDGRRVVWARIARRAAASDAPCVADPAEASRSDLP